MFIDRARIRVAAGRGGDGCCSFRREKYVPKGGPDGGDGGDGGDVYFKAENRLSSLLDLRYHSTWKGNPGVHGMGKDMHGKRGEPMTIALPPGTIVLDYETGETLCELLEPGDTMIAAKGGKGGKGNARFLSNRNRAPKFAEKGEPGEEREFLLELKVIAEVGLVGLPNAGKSTFLSVVTAATPKIADYPFTTLSPNLGVTKLSDYRTLTIADIPGIIEGAAEGKGLGHDFLRHIERTKVLLFMIDLGDADPAATYALLESELAQHSNVFATRPRIIALNKADVTENRERFDEVAKEFETAPFMISAATNEGIDVLMEAVWDAVERAKAEEEAAITIDGESSKDYVFEAPFTIEPTEDGYRVEGERALRAVRMTNFENEEAVTYLQKRLERMGIFKALKREGAADGATIHIGDFELEYHAE